LTERSHTRLDTGVTDGFHYCGCDNSPDEKIKYSTTDSNLSEEEEFHNDRETDRWLKESKEKDKLDKEKGKIMGMVKGGMEELIE